MVRKRVTSFPRQILICLIFSLMAILFALSCQKDDGLKQKDPNALTKVQAKEYFEQNAKTLKFLTVSSTPAGTTPAGTKSADYSLRENMIIEWDQALEGETANSYIVEIPIKIICGLEAYVHEGLGQYNTKIKKSTFNSSLLITRLKGSGVYSHNVVYCVGESSKNKSRLRYPYSNPKDSFSGYIIISSEGGVFQKLFHYDNNHVHEISVNELISSRSQKIDKLGHDLSVRGIRLTLPLAALTKGGGGSSSGEDNLCPYCLQNGLSFNGNYYYCSNCEGVMYVFEYLVCPDCLSQIYECSCVCPKCGFPNKNGNKCHCSPGPYENPCLSCGAYGCNGQCVGIGDPNRNEYDTYTVTTHTNNQGGYITRSVERAYYFYNECLTLTAYPYSGYSFTGWYENNVLISSLSSYYFTITENRNIVAHFEEQ